MVLNHFHVFQRYPCTVGQRHSVPGLYPAVSCELVNPPASTCGNYHRLCQYGHEFPCSKLDRSYSLHLPSIDKEGGDEPFVVAVNAGKLQARLEERVQKVKANLVCGEYSSLDRHPPESSDADASVRVPAEGTSPVFQANGFTGRFSDEELHSVLVCEKVASFDGVVGVGVKAVVVSQDRGHSSLCGDCVASHWVDLRDYGNVQFRAELSRRDGRPQASGASSYDQDVVAEVFHGALTCSVERLG